VNVTFKGEPMAVLSGDQVTALRTKHDDALAAKREELPKVVSEMFGDRDLATVTNAHISLRELGDLLDTIQAFK
jgi:hypothetical protein